MFSSLSYFLGLFAPLALPNQVLVDHQCAILPPNAPFRRVCILADLDIDGFRTIPGSLRVGVAKFRGEALKIEKKIELLDPKLEHWVDKKIQCTYLGYSIEINLGNMSRNDEDGIRKTAGAVNIDGKKYQTGFTRFRLKGVY